MIIPVGLAIMLQRCAPQVGPVTMSSVVQYESGWQPNAINDNTTGRSYFPRRQEQAIRLASQLLAQGHVIDAGLAQVDSANFASYGATVASIFDPCTNLYIGSRILLRSYAGAVLHYGPGQIALWHALQAYNSGALNGRPSYARGVFALALNSQAITSVLPPYNPPAQLSFSVSARTVPRSVLIAHVHLVSPVRLVLTADNVFYFPDQTFGASGTLREARKRGPHG
jgi:type IV secretion system protein VirB1